MKQSNGNITIIDLNKLRDMGYTVFVKPNGTTDHAELHISPRHTIPGPVLKQEIAENLEATIGAKRANKVEMKAIELINAAQLQDALKSATRA